MIDYYSNNTDARTLRDLSDLLEPQDRHRFYRVHDLDSSTIVVVYQVRLEPSGKIYRDRSETNEQNHEHAELVAIKKISKWLDERNLNGEESISLTTMATSSPCLDCQTAILDMLKKWRERLTVSYKLRIGYLYHDPAPNKRLSDTEVKVKLADWKRKIKGSGVEFTLEAIAVCDELSVPSLETRQESLEDVISERGKKDSKIADHVQKINSQTRMEDHFEREAKDPMRQIKQSERK